MLRTSLIGGGCIHYTNATTMNDEFGVVKRLTSFSLYVWQESFCVILSSIWTLYNQEQSKTKVTVALTYAAELVK